MYQFGEQCLKEIGKSVDDHNYIKWLESKFAQLEDMNRFCPDCGKKTLRLIETVDQGDEIKEVHSCDECYLIVNVFRNKSSLESNWIENFDSRR